ncbi:hypothetical protein AAZX31_18G072800 [Glycine max]
MVAKNFDVLALYASIKAIETRSSSHDQQWLTYWVLYSLISHSLSSHLPKFKKYLLIICSNE